MRADIESADDFMMGQMDCQEGLPEQKKTKDYRRGYRTQYESEQVAAELTEYQNGLIRKSRRVMQ